MRRADAVPARPRPARALEALPAAERKDAGLHRPCGRLGTVDEIADVVAFLVSPRASWVVGTCDGGSGHQKPSTGRRSQCSNVWSVLRS